MIGFDMHSPPEPSMKSERPESLRPVLKEAEERLVQHISDVCSNDHLPDESTGELIKLEEPLSMAAEAAKEAISIRRRIRARGDVSPETTATESPRYQEPPTASA